MRWYVKEALSAAAGLAAFGAVLLIDTATTYLLISLATGGTGYFAVRLLLPRTREAGESVEVVAKSELNEAELIAALLQQGKEYNVWFKECQATIAKLNPAVVPKLEKIRQLIKAIHAHFEKDPFEPRTLSVTMDYYLKTFERSLNGYVGVLESEYKNDAVQSAIKEFEEGLDGVEQGFDHVYTALVKHQLNSLKALQLEFKQVRRATELTNN